MAASKQQQQQQQKQRTAVTSEPPPHYGVLSEADVTGRVWHYPVALTRAALSPAGAALGEAYPHLIYFMRLPHGGQGASRRPRAPIRFTSRLRAVRFTERAAASDREVIQSMAQDLAQDLAQHTTSLAEGA